MSHICIACASVLDTPMSGGERSKHVLTGALQAPPSFQPPIAFTTTSSSTTAIPKAVKIEPDLITRYNLQSRISSKGKEKEEEPTQPGWSSNKEDRQKLLQRRRDEMILKARRRMEEQAAEQDT